MAEHAAPIDATHMPDVSRLVREVARTGQARKILADGDEAVLAPASRRRSRAKQQTQAEFEAEMRATFGGLKDLIDPDEFKRQRRELQVDNREPRSL